jgi:hypothetical protein
MRALVFVRNATAAGQQQGRQLARQAGLRGKQAAGLAVGAEMQYDGRHA